VTSSSAAAGSSGGVRLVVVGGSWGGLEAACRVLDGLVAPLPVPFLLVLHRAPSSDAATLRAAVLRCSGQHLVEVEDKTVLEGGLVYLAPPDYHVLVDGGSCSLSTDVPVSGSRPSIDVAFESAADDLGADVVGVLLSGTGRDGARGLRRVLEAGGRTFAQDPETAERGEMPRSAIALDAAQHVGAPEQLAAMLALLLPRHTAG